MICYIFEKQEEYEFNYFYRLQLIVNWSSL